MLVDVVVDAAVQDGEVGRNRTQVEQSPSRLGRDLFVGVEDQRPALRGHPQRHVAGPAEIAAPFAVLELGSELLRDLDRAIGRAGVDDDNLVDDAFDAAQAVFEEALLVLDDHAQADPLGELLAVGGRGRQAEQELAGALGVGRS